jgi:CubicO group peptidase (beta-lactamase class C family)
MTAAVTRRVLSLGRFAKAPVPRLLPLLLVLVVLPLGAAVSVGKPEDVGLSSERLHRIDDVIQRAIDAKQIAGAVTIVSRKNRVAHFEAQGFMDIESKAAMKKDAIFRMASMSKPVTSVAILMLLEEGKVRLTDPVAKFIPEFKDTKVAMVQNGSESAPATAPATATTVPAGRGGRGGGRGAAVAQQIALVPAARPITIRDLLTHTSGLESGGAGSREGNRLAPRDGKSTLAEYVPKLGAVPLDFQPGTEWRYSSLAGMETLGRIVEIASGMTFDQFLKTRLFDPLGMKDTGFVVPEDKQSRIASLYGRPQGATTGLEKQPTPGWLDTKTLFSGGGGLWSTAEDYLQFATMLVNGGQLNGKRFLSPRTVDLMGSNQLGDLYSKANRPGMGWGTGVEITMDPVAANRRVGAGSFGWDGAFGTHFWVDRKEQIAGVLLIQQGVQAQLNRDFENAVMQAIVD